MVHIRTLKIYETPFRSIKVIFFARNMCDLFITIWIHSETGYYYLCCEWFQVYLMRFHFLED